MYAYAESNEKNDLKNTVQKKVKTNLTGIPDTMKMHFENNSGLSFDDVRVHYNSDKPAQLHALAYTQGNQVYVASGQEKHLGHELGHIVQQKQGRIRPTTQQNGIAINDDTTLEREADTFLTHIQTQAQVVPRETQVVQRILTRSAYAKLLSDIYNNGRSLGAEQIVRVLRERGYADFDIKRAFDELGIFAEPVDEAADTETGDAYHAQDTNALEIPCTPDDIDNENLRREMFFQTNPFSSAQFTTAQLRRAGNKDSYPKTFDSSISGRYTDVVYRTDTRGGLDFARYQSAAAPLPINPISGKVVKLNQDCKNKDKGMMKSGNLVDIRTASREQHFSIANRITRNAYSSQSPPNLTWHHLLEYPEMVLVDQKVHAKYGHNGGYLLW